MLNSESRIDYDCGIDSDLILFTINICIYLSTLAGTGHFASFDGTRGEGGMVDATPLAFGP